MEGYEGEQLTNIVGFEFEHITKKRGMCVIKVAVSLPDLFHGGKVK